MLKGRWPSFTGPAYEQEDDITLVIVEYVASAAAPAPVNEDLQQEEIWETLAEFSLPSEPGNEILAKEESPGLIQGFNLPNDRLERLEDSRGRGHHECHGTRQPLPG